MIRSTRFIGVLDANVIHPIIVRDLLFWFAYDGYNLYTPKWSKHIFDEWESVMRRKGTPKVEIRKRIDKARQAFPDAMVQNYEGLIEALTLPDPKDRHVLAAAIKVNAHVIITNNLKDFPPDYLSNFDVRVQSPDDFLADIIDLHPDAAMMAFRRLVFGRKNPNLNEYQVLDQFRQNNLNDTANYLHALL